VYDIYVRDDRVFSSDAYPSTTASLMFLGSDIDDEGDGSEEEGDPEDVDSNAEDYYQNEYPDEDEWHSESEERPA